MFGRKPKATNPAPSHSLAVLNDDEVGFRYTFTAEAYTKKTDPFPYRVWVYDIDGNQIGKLLSDYKDIASTAELLAKKYVESLGFADVIEGEGVLL